MGTTEIFPSLKKRLFLLVLIIALASVVVALAPFPSNSFILYFGLCFIAFCNTIVRLFNRKPVLILSELGILSNMTINAEKIGLISWTDINEIRDARLLWLIKNIELHATESVAAKYQSWIDKKDQIDRKTLLISLTNEEIGMKHEDLILLLNQYWNAYKNR